MKLTNNEIYTYASNLLQHFNDGEQRLPVKVNFYLQKNKKTLVELAQDIEKTRIEIAQTHGSLDEGGEQYAIDPDKIEIVAKELEDLFGLEQDVKIYTVSIDAFNDDQLLTTAQMEALMFMID